MNQTGEISLTTEMTPKIDTKGVAFSLRSRDYKDVQCVCYRGDSITSPINASNPSAGDPCHTLTNDSRNYIVIENHPNDGRVKICEDGVFQTLSSRMGTGGNNVPLLAVEPKAIEAHAQDARYNINDINQTLGANMEHDPSNGGLVMQNDKCISSNNTIVRRLTPTECERLQGFPSGWTDIGDWTDSKGKKHKGDADAPRYKALGNSIALPFWQWMADRMVVQLAKSGVEAPTMGSLFDGIAGFPFVYLKSGCQPVWCSEIEEFPIAVCKMHFGDEDANKKGDIEKFL